VNECKPLKEGKQGIISGRAVQVEPMKPVLKAPVSKHLKLKCDETTFNFCFQILLAPLHMGIIGIGAFLEKEFSNMIKVWLHFLIVTPQMTVPTATAR
jgi:uncharacterized protein (DUF983 family)